MGHGSKETCCVIERDLRALGADWVSVVIKLKLPHTHTHTSTTRGMCYWLMCTVRERSGRTDASEIMRKKHIHQHMRCKMHKHRSSPVHQSDTSSFWFLFNTHPLTRRHCTPAPRSYFAMPMSFPHNFCHRSVDGLLTHKTWGLL